MNASRSIASIESASKMLSALGFDAERCNERSALVLLALANLEPQCGWEQSASRLVGVTPIMEFAQRWGKTWKPNTRETIRRRTLHQFVEQGLALINSDDPTRAVNSPKTNYCLDPASVTLIQQWETETWSSSLKHYLSERPARLDSYAKARELNRIKVAVPGGVSITLTPGGQNVLIAQILEEFCSRFAPGGEVLYVGDAGTGDAIFDSDALGHLGISLDKHGKLPDVVVWMRDRNWLFLIEAATSHGPVDISRYAELSALFQQQHLGLIYVSCFPDRAAMRPYLHELAWETEVWCADSPDHMVHLNGSRFLGPY